MKQFSKDLGNVSIAPKGKWNREQEYERLALVYNACDNLSYVAKINVPSGVDIENREYWQPMNATGYADNNFINLTAENENGTITAYETLEKAVATILPINRRAGATLSFYNLNSDRLDRQAEFELWQFNSTDLANWENKDYWNNIYYNWNVFAGWYIGADALKNHVKIPTVGQYAYVGSNLNDAVLYQCRTNGTWINTGTKVRNYISVVVSGNITIGENGNWFSDGKDTGIPATPAVDEQLDNIGLQIRQHSTELDKLQKQDVILKSKIDSNFETINNKIDNIKTVTDSKIDTADANLQKQITGNNNDIATLNTKHESLSKTVKGIAVTGGASTATNVTYNKTNSGLNAENAQDAIDETNDRISKLDSSDYKQDLTITYLEDRAKGKINIDSLYIKFLNLNPISTIFKLRVYKNRKIGDFWFDGFAMVAYGKDYPSVGQFVCQNYVRESKSDPFRFETNYSNKLIKLSGANVEAYIKVISANTNANVDFVIKNRSFYPNPTYNEYYIENKKVSIPDNVATVDNLNIVDNKVEQLKNSLDTQSQQILTVENQVTNRLNEFQEIIDSEENKSKFIGVFNLSSELPTEGIKENSYAYANNPRTEWLFKSGRWEDTGIEMPITVLSEEDYVKKTAFDTTIKELRFGKENTLAGEYIYISTQEEFGNLLATVKQKVDEYIALSTKDLYTISILIHGGIYKFSSIQKLELDSYTKAYNISINISAVPGEKVYVISDGEELTPNDAIALTPTHYICNISDYNTSYGFVDQDFNYIKVQNTGNVDMLGINLMTERPTFDLGLKQIKFKIPDELSILKNKELEYFKNSYLYFTCQWFDYTAHNIYSDDTYIYATYDTSGENINAIEMDVVDEKYNLPTRFYITNIPDIKLDANQVLINNNKIYIPRNISKLYLMKYSNLFKFKNLHFSNIVLSNINFVGSVYNQSSLIKFMDCNNVYCNYNTFKNINSFNCITIDGSASSYTPNKETHTGTQTYYSVNNNISYNKFIDIGVSAFRGGKVSGVEFSYNYLYNTGILRCNQAIMLTGKDNHVSYNKFINIPFNSIYLLGPINYFTAVIEYNEFYNTNDYNNTYIAHSLIDGGVIYSGWHSDDTIIRYNIFHDKRSYANYRGIMVDSGGYNVSIYGNLFYRIQNSFTIDLRQVTATNDMEIRDRNTNNFVYDNIIVGTCKLMGNPEHPNEVYLGNNIYCTKYSTNKTNVTTNAKLTGKSIEDSNLFIENDIIYLTKNPNFNISPFIKSRLIIGV